MQWWTNRADWIDKSTNELKNHCDTYHNQWKKIYQLLLAVFIRREKNMTIIVISQLPLSTSHSFSRSLSLSLQSMIILLSAPRCQRDKKNMFSRLNQFEENERVCFLIIHCKHHCVSRSITQIACIEKKSVNSKWQIMIFYFAWFCFVRLCSCAYWPPFEPGHGSGDWLISEFGRKFTHHWASDAGEGERGSDWNQQSVAISDAVVAHDARAQWAFQWQKKTPVRFAARAIHASAGAYTLLAAAAVA